MVQFTALLKKFGEKGEKTGWTYIDVPEKIAQQLKPNHKTSFRVKGKLDNYSIHAVALLPKGDGGFIMAINATMRKAIKKQKGAMVLVTLEADDAPFEINKALLECLNDEPVALANFNKLPGSHQKYYSKWIESAKTEQTKTKRIAQAVDALAKNFHYGQMIRSLKKEPDNY
ncbi:MAG: YdeI/OmpD-associated family protein [Ilyomonas sp.]